MSVKISESNASVLPMSADVFIIQSWPITDQPLRGVSANITSRSRPRSSVPVLCYKICAIRQMQCRPSVLGAKTKCLQVSGCLSDPVHVVCKQKISFWTRFEILINLTYFGIGRPQHKLGILDQRRMPKRQKRRCRCSIHLEYSWRIPFCIEYRHRRTRRSLGHPSC